MKTGLKVGLFIVIIGGLGVGGYFLYKKFYKKSSLGLNAEENRLQGGGQSTAPKTNDIKPSVPPTPPTPVIVPTGNEGRGAGTGRG